MAVRHAAGGKLEHIEHGTSRFMYCTNMLDALKFKDEWAISPDEFENQTEHMQRIIKGMGARVKVWTDKEREAYKRKLAGHVEPTIKVKKADKE